MILCSKCSYAWNPDTATNCVQCKAPIGAASDSGRGDTQNDDRKGAGIRRSTIAEGVSSGVSAPPAIAKPREPEAPQPRWNDAQAKDRAERRRTVFAGTPASPEAASSSPAASPATSVSGQRRPQTIAVDSSRKIVGVLITYSWEEQGQVFPILEGRNLIGKDPDQCDITIPQDATLSAVNSFITYRRNFIIGDKVSMSGTDVDGEPIETEFVTLRNYAKIRTGSTHWTFVAIQPPAAPSSDSAAGNF